jgi:UDP:flavonoid glycosyltransferase YjiC (YdhE family)
VYASFGSQAWHQPDRYRAIAAATRELDVDVIIAMGDLAEPMAAELERPRLRCVRFAPQLDLLGRASALITHGGANSVMEALALGVPLVVAPICNDQPHNLRILERSGAGVGVDLSSLSPGAPRRPAALEPAAYALREALRAVLGDGPQRAATARLTASYASRSGAEGAASLAARHARSPSSLGGPL